MKVLIVDDDRDNRELLAIVLAREGYDVATAASGEDALVHIAAEPPHLVVLDVIMTGIDGYEVATAIKRGETTRHIPIIMLSGLSDASATKRMREAGVEALLLKPVDRHELCDRVRSLLPTA